MATVSLCCVFVLVKWVTENRYTVITRNRIVVEYRTKEDEEITSKIIPCLWKAKPYDAEIILCGEKTNLEFELETILAEIAEARQPNKSDETRQSNKQPASQQQRILEVVSESQSLLADFEETNYKDLYESELLKTAKYKNKIKSLKRKLKDFNQVCRGEEVVKLSDTTSIKKSQLDMVKTISGSATVFSRNLMRLIFSEDELCGKSLFGRKSNANASPAKESIDSSRRDAIILQAIEVFGNTSGLIKEIHRSMGDYIREVTRKNYRQQNS